MIRRAQDGLTLFIEPAWRAPVVSIHPRDPIRFGLLETHVQRGCLSLKRTLKDAEARIRQGMQVVQCAISAVIVDDQDLKITEALRQDAVHGRLEEWHPILNRHHDGKIRIQAEDLDGAETGLRRAGDARHHP